MVHFDRPPLSENRARSRSPVHDGWDELIDSFLDLNEMDLVDENAGMENLDVDEDCFFSGLGGEKKVDLAFISFKTAFSWLLTA